MSILVSPAADGELSVACRILTSQFTGFEQQVLMNRYHNLFASRELDRSGLFLARRDGEPVGAMIVQALSGALGLAWPPRVLPDLEQPAIERQLAQVCCQWLQSQGSKICQAFATSADRSLMQPLQVMGFRRITEVVHLHHTAFANEVLPHVEESLIFQMVQPDHLPEFTTTLLATYEGSQDCPELTGDRTPEELVSGFINLNSRSIAQWYLVKRAGMPIGVLLLEHGPEPDAVEVNYLGLIPNQRRSGWGTHLVHYAMQFASALGAKRLTLSVDSRNEAARRLYEKLGFEEFDQREVYLAEWPQTTTGMNDIQVDA